MIQSSCALRITIFFGNVGIHRQTPRTGFIVTDISAVIILQIDIGYDAGEVLMRALHVPRLAEPATQSLIPITFVIMLCFFLADTPI